MKRFLLALITAAFAFMTVGAMAAEEKPYTAQAQKPGRAADDSSTVKSNPAAAAEKPGRAADETATTGKKKHGKKAKKKTPTP